MFDGDAGTGCRFGDEELVASLDAMRALKDSLEHDEILTDPQFETVGIARVRTLQSDWGWYWVVVFGTEEKGR